MQNKEKKPSKRRYIIPALFFMLLIFAIFAYAVLLQQAKPDPASEQAIRKRAAMHIYKNANELTEEDIANMKLLQVFQEELCDIGMIEKFKNLERLDFIWIKFPDRAIPKWMKTLGKLHIIDIKKRASLDLSPIEKLVNLKTIEFYSAPVRSFKPLSKLKNLEMLSISNMDIIDYESLKTLKNLKTLYLLDIKNITDKQIEELQKSLPETEVTTEKWFISQFK